MGKLTAKVAARPKAVNTPTSSGRAATQRSPAAPAPVLGGRETAGVSCARGRIRPGT
ncbi:hypothetical protein [Streptomyces sp. NPDC056683]|uniref:hypothetical protein n=1 Tax=Streptomyces sp. NPDC056683 TaxID=3345910 RepID=UPI0036D1D3B0